METFGIVAEYILPSIIASPHYATVWLHSARFSDIYAYPIYKIINWQSYATKNGEMVFFTFVFESLKLASDPNVPLTV